MERRRLGEHKVKEKEQLDVKPDWSKFVMSKFNGCKLLAAAKATYCSGYYLVYWLGVATHVGVVDPNGGCTICPVLPGYLKSLGVDLLSLVGKAKAGKFPEVRVPVKRAKIIKKTRLVRSRKKLALDSKTNKPKRRRLKA